jgi:hypothetical protein
MCHDQTQLRVVGIAVIALMLMAGLFAEAST